MLGNFFSENRAVYEIMWKNIVIYSLYNVSKEYNLEIATKRKTKVFGFVGTDHLRTKIIINDETLEQVNLFAYLFR